MMMKKKKKKKKDVAAKLLRRLDVLRMGIGDLKVDINNLLIRLATRKWQFCRAGRTSFVKAENCNDVRAGVKGGCCAECFLSLLTNQWQTQSVLVECDSGCSYVMHSECFDRFIERYGGEYGPIDVRWSMTGPHLKGKPCKLGTCINGHISCIAAFDNTEHQFHRWILHPYLHVRTINEPQRKPINLKSRFPNAHLLSELTESCCNTVVRLSSRRPSSLPTNRSPPPHQPWSSSSTTIRTQKTSLLPVNPLESIRSICKFFRKISLSASKRQSNSSSVSSELGTVVGNGQLKNKNDKDDLWDDFESQILSCFQNPIDEKKIDEEDEDAGGKESSSSSGKHPPRKKRRQCPVFMITGPSSSGKSSLLAHLVRIWHFDDVFERRQEKEKVQQRQRATVFPPRPCCSCINSQNCIKWDSRLPIISQFGKHDKLSSPESEAIKWMSCVGINSIPAWCSPYHVLSTGQKYRAQLARQLQAFTSQTSFRGHPLVLDNFTHHLDPDSARCVAAALSGYIRRSRREIRQRLHHRTEKNRLPLHHHHHHLLPSCIFVACSEPSIADYLQPDVLIRTTATQTHHKNSRSSRCSSNISSSSAEEIQAVVEINPRPVTPIPVMFDVDTSSLSFVSSSSSSTLLNKLGINELRRGGEGERTKQLAEEEESSPRNKVMKQRKREEENNNKEDDDDEENKEADEQEIKKQEGNGKKEKEEVVLFSRVQADAVTAGIDALFDLPFNGLHFHKIPSFPSAEVLGNFHLGVISGPSGSSKSVLAKYHFGGASKVEWCPHLEVLEHFYSIEDATRSFALVELPLAVGGKKFHELSDSEKERATLARLVLVPGAVFDEFGSNLDQRTLQAISSNLSRHFFLESAKSRDCKSKFTSSLPLELKTHVPISEKRKGEIAVRCGRLNSNNHGILLVTCVGAGILSSGHLRPDWIYDTGSKTFHRPNARSSKGTNSAIPWNDSSEGNNVNIKIDECHLQLGTPPTLHFRLEMTTPRLWNSIFSQHHYKSSALSTRAECYVVYYLGDLKSHSRPYQEGGEKKEKTRWQYGVGGGGGGGGEIKRQEKHQPIAFLAVIPHKNNSRNYPSESNSNAHTAYRAHRTVVLPEWQGMGIGSRLSDVGGEIYRRRGKKYFAQTVHPRFGSYRDRSPYWKALKWNHALQAFKYESWSHIKSHTQIRLRRPRVMYAHEYVGTSNQEEGQELDKRFRFL